MCKSQAVDRSKRSLSKSESSLESNNAILLPPPHTHTYHIHTTPDLVRKDLKSTLRVLYSVFSKYKSRFQQAQPQQPTTPTSPHPPVSSM